MEYSTGTPKSTNFLIGFDRPQSPSSDQSSPSNEPPEFVSRPRDLSDDDDDEDYPARSRSAPRKKGVYNSRIEQILYENPQLQIVITDAGKSNESGGSYIVYTIRTGVCYKRGSKWLSESDELRILKYGGDIQSSVL